MSSFANEASAPGRRAIRAAFTPFSISFASLISLAASFDPLLVPLLLEPFFLKFEVLQNSHRSDDDTSLAALVHHRARVPIFPR